MADKPQDRYQSAEEVLADLHALALPGAIAVPTPRSDLHIEIDTASLNRQVAEIEEMDYFQQLLKEAELLRNSVETNPEIQLQAKVLQPEAATPPKLNPAFLDRCRQELARRTGPIARSILEETLAEYPDISPAQLVEALAPP